MVIGALLAVDCAVITLWIIIDPMNRQVELYPEQVGSRYPLNYSRGSRFMPPNIINRNQRRMLTYFTCHSFPSVIPYTFPNGWEHSMPTRDCCCFLGYTWHGRLAMSKSPPWMTLSTLEWTSITWFYHRSLWLSSLPCWPINQPCPTRSFQLWFCCQPPDFCLSSSCPRSVGFMCKKK